MLMMRCIWMPARARRALTHSARRLSQLLMKHFSKILNKNFFILLFLFIFSFVYEKEIKIKNAKKIETPFGGQLVYTMPGHNLLVIHLKDKSKIRIKKRWSQVMYMYHLLAYRACGSLEAIMKLYESCSSNWKASIDYLKGSGCFLSNIDAKKRRKVS